MYCFNDLRDFKSFFQFWFPEYRLKGLFRTKDEDIFVFDVYRDDIQSMDDTDNLICFINSHPQLMHLCYSSTKTEISFILNTNL